MLKQMRRGSTVEHIKRSLSSLSNSGIPFSISLMFGAPGESPDTIAETFDLIDRFSVPEGIWVSIGICLWTHHQAVLDDARKAGQLGRDQELF